MISELGVWVVERLSNIYRALLPYWDWVADKYYQRKGSA